MRQATRAGSEPPVPFIAEFGGGALEDGSAIILAFKLSDGRRFAGLLPLGKIDSVLGCIEGYVKQSAERVDLEDRG